MKKLISIFVFVIILILCGTSLAAEAKYLAGGGTVEAKVGEYITFDYMDYSFEPEGSTLEGKTIDSDEFYFSVGTSADENSVTYDWISYKKHRISFQKPGIYFGTAWICRMKDYESLIHNITFSFVISDMDGNLPELHPALEIDPIPDKIVGSSIQLFWKPIDVILPYRELRITVMKDGKVLDEWECDPIDEEDTFRAEEVGTYTFGIKMIDAKGTEVYSESSVNVIGAMQGVTTENSLKLSKEPKEDAGEVVALRKGMDVLIDGEEEDWYHITVDIDGDVREGYLPKDMVEIEK